MSYDDQIINEIKFKSFLIELAKNEELSEVLIDFSCRKGFVDLFAVSAEPKYKNFILDGVQTKMGPNELKALFKMFERQCPGIVEFKKKGWNGILGYPLVRITTLGHEVANMLATAKDNRNQAR